MRATASRNRRCRAPVYHFVISWRYDENPTEAIMRQVADTTCTDLELDDHQRLYVAHTDTRHHHLHVVVNRVHPETGKAWNRRQDWVRIEQSLADQSRALGLEHVPGRHTDPERTRTKPRRPKDAVFQKTRPEESLRLLDSWSDERIQRERDGLARLFDEAKSWDELQGGLAERGLVLVPKGQGLVIADVEGAMKVSNLGKPHSHKHLESRLGENIRADLSPAQSAKDAARIATYEAAHDVNERLDFAFALYRMGLVTAKQIDRLVAEKADTQTALDGQLTLRERVARELAEKMRFKAEKDEGADRTHRRRREPDRSR